MHSVSENCPKTLLHDRLNDGKQTGYLKCKEENSSLNIYSLNVLFKILVAEVLGLLVFIELLTLCPEMVMLNPEF